MISIKNDEETLRAIIVLQTQNVNLAFERFLWWLRASFEKEMESIDFSTEAQGTYRTGAVQQLHQILKNIHDARANLDTLKRNREMAESIKNLNIK